MAKAGMRRPEPKVGEEKIKQAKKKNEIPEARNDRKTKDANKTNCCE